MQLFPLYYLAPVSYYSRLYRTLTSGEPWAFNTDDRWEKQTLRSRCFIAGPDGPQRLSIPIQHRAPLPSPSSAESSPFKGELERVSEREVSLTRDLLLSDHGNWRHQHWHALVSAYDQSPFFAYYADDFRPHFLPGAHTTLWDFNLALHQVVASCLDLAHLPSPSSAESSPFKGELERVSYYQVFSARTGFLPDLSIVDLIFNMGPEARLWL